MSPTPNRVGLFIVYNLKKVKKQLKLLALECRKPSLERETVSRSAGGLLWSEKRSRGARERFFVPRRPTAKRGKASVYQEGFLRNATRFLITENLPFPDKKQDPRTGKPQFSHICWHQQSFIQQLQSLNH